MNKFNKGIIPLIVIIVIAAVVLIGGGATYYYYTTQIQQKPTTTCTKEAKVCPDGSSVYRAESNCEFTSCPTTNTNTGMPSITSISPSSGPVGTVVTLTGNNFTSGSATYIGISESGQKALTPNSVSSTQIKFTIPANLPIGSHNVSVFVTAPQTPTSNSVIFTVTSVSSQPSITVTSPNGGEVWKAGTIHNITWTSTGVSYVKIFLNNDTINSSLIPASTGSYSWTVPSTYPTGTTYKIMIGSTDVGGSVIDYSNNNFSIVAPTTTPSITVTSPNGGEVWQTGSTHNITWSSSGLSKYPGFPITITVQNASGATVYTTSYNIGSTEGGYVSWLVPNNLSSGQYKVKLDPVLPSYYGDDGIWDMSNNYFTITPASTQPSLTQEQAQALVLQTWGGCDPNSCESVTTTVQNNNGQYTVTAIIEGLRDDSVSAEKRVAPAYYSNNVWTLGNSTSTWRCQYGRGQQDFSSALCF